jgi:uncharacterized protein involved in exopolysaccharide biosynthesis
MNGNDENLETAAPDARLFDHRDREKIAHYASFVLGSVRRHRLLVIAVFAAIIGATVGTFFAFPKTYHVEAKALAQPDSALVVRGDGPGAESLTRVAAETVLRRDNLVALVQQTDLLRYTRDHRAPVQRARDAIMKALHRPEDSEADRLDALVELLEKSFGVWTSESGSTVTIAIDWSDAPMACRLVDAAQRAFLDTRYAREITALSESIWILKGHTASLKADIDDAVVGIEGMRATRDLPKANVGDPVRSLWPRVLSIPRPVAPHAAGPNLEAQQLKADIDAKLHAVDELEEFRRHRLSELQAHLAEARTTYTESHPAIVDLKQSISALSVESPQVTSLRHEAASLKAEYDQKGAGATNVPASAVASTPVLTSLSAGAAATPPQLPSDVLRLDFDLREDRDPGMVYARGQLRDAMDKYAALRTQIQTGQIDLETAQAAFKYRYSVVTPAHLPKNPTKPNIPLVLLVALVAATLCGILCAVVSDVRAGRLLEHWQLRQLLDLPILGDIALPMLKEHDFE